MTFSRGVAIVISPAQSAAKCREEREKQEPRVLEQRLTAPAQIAQLSWISAAMSPTPSEARKHRVAWYAFPVVWRERTRTIAREAGMDSVLKFARALALGTWVGSLIYFVAIVTRGAFAVLTRDQAGLLVGFMLAGLHEIGIIAAIVYLIASLGVAMSIEALGRPAALGVILMLLLTLISQRMVIPRMESLRQQMDSVDSTPPTDPRRVEFDRLHGMSVDLEAGVLLIGFVALFLSVREQAS
jgi:hypothetical protein